MKTKLSLEANTERVTDQGGGRLEETGGSMNAPLLGRATAAHGKNRITRPTQCDELAPHNEVDGSVAEVNAAVVPGSNAFLPGEIPAGRPDGKSAEAVVP